MVLPYNWPVPANNEDRQWLSERLDKLDQKIELLESGLRNEMRPLLREHLNRVEGKIEKVESTLRSEMQELREQLEDRIEKVETTLLTEFHKWASPLEMRQRTHTATLRALDAEMEYLSDKIKKLEDR